MAVAEAAEVVAEVVAEGAVGLVDVSVADGDVEVSAAVALVVSWLSLAPVPSGALAPGLHAPSTRSQTNAPRARSALRMRAMIVSGMDAVGVEAFIPTLDAAVKAGIALPSGPAVETSKLVALVVAATVRKREVWREDRMMTTADAERIPRQPPEVRNAGGFSSWLVSQREEGAFVRARLEHVTDKVVRIRDVLIPSELSSRPVLFGVESAIEELVPELLPDFLECKDLRTASERSAYRGTMGAVAAPKFHGHDFGDTIEQGRKMVEAMSLVRGQLLGVRVRAFAWPLLWLRWEAASYDQPGPQVVLLTDQNFQLRALTGTELRRRDEERGG